MWFNMTAVDTDMFIMADNVHQLIEIFDEAASFEDRIIKPIESVFEICHVLVSVLVAYIVGRYLYHNCLKNLHRSVKRMASYPPKIVAEKKSSNEMPIMQKTSVRGSNRKFRKTEEENIYSEKNAKDIQHQTVRGYSSTTITTTKVRRCYCESDTITGRHSNISIADGDDITLKSEKSENLSIKLIGTPEWAEHYLATGGPRHSHRCF